MRLVDAGLLGILFVAPLFMGGRHPTGRLVFVLFAVVAAIHVQEAETVVIDQEGCVYQPRVSGIQVCQPAEFLNSDKFLHNVHSVSTANPAFNFALSTVGQKRERRFEAEEMVLLKCDVHPWMRGYVLVRESPYFDVTDETGAFKIANLPTGEWKFQVWHEKGRIRDWKKP